MKVQLKERELQVEVVAILMYHLYGEKNSTEYPDRVLFGDLCVKDEVYEFIVPFNDRVRIVNSESFSCS